MPESRDYAQGDYAPETPECPEGCPDHTDPQRELEELRRRVAASPVIRGRRVYEEHPYQPGDYALIGEDWWAKPPLGFPAAKLGAHEVVEHNDGTITVHGSILYAPEDGRRFHGFLIRGDWRILDDTEEAP